MISIASNSYLTLFSKLISTADLILSFSFQVYLALNLSVFCTLRLVESVLGGGWFGFQNKAS